MFLSDTTFHQKNVLSFPRDSSLFSRSKYKHFSSTIRAHWNPIASWLRGVRDWGFRPIIFQGNTSLYITRLEGSFFNSGFRVQNAKLIARCELRIANFRLG